MVGIVQPTLQLAVRLAELTAGADLPTGVGQAPVVEPEVSLPVGQEQDLKFRLLTGRETLVGKLPEAPQCLLILLKE